MEENIIKDFGEVQVPTSWEEVTLERFVEIMRMQDAKGEESDIDIVDVMAVLTGKDRDFVNGLPSTFVEKILSHLTFLNIPLDQTPKSEVKIDGEVYHINYMEKLSFGEYTDANTVMQGDKFNYAALLAILCRKKGERYTEDYIAGTLDDRIEMWKKQPITNVYPLVCFFLTLSALSTGHFLDFLTKEEQILSQLLRSIKSSLLSGDGLAHPIRSVKTWWKLRKLEKCISQQY